MLVRICKAIVAVALGLALGLGVASGQAKQPQWKDRAEYDLVMAIEKEANAEARLKLLEQWTEKYPTTDLTLLRLQTYYQTYQQLGRVPDVLSTARSILEIVPKDVGVLSTVAYFTTMLPKPSPDDLSAAEKAAQSVVGLLDAEFAAGKKPAEISDADWKKRRTVAEANAHRTLGWVAMQHKNYEVAEKAFVRTLGVNPEQGEVSYWLGQMILYQKKAERQSDALFHFARAAAYTGTGALSPQGRQQVGAYLAKAYRTYHGEDAAGLKNLQELAQSRAFPPEGFRIKSVHELEAEKRAALAQADPALALWVSIRENLVAEGGERYFTDSMKDALVPPESMPAFKGTLVSQDPAKNPKTLVLAIQNPDTPDVTLKLDTAMTGAAPAGTVLQFRGAPESFAKEPFMVTFQVEKENVSGCPAPTPPAKKAPRKAAPKK